MNSRNSHGINHSKVLDTLDSTCFQCLEILSLTLFSKIKDLTYLWVEGLGLKHRA